MRLSKIMIVNKVITYNFIESTMNNVDIQIEITICYLIDILLDGYCHSNYVSLFNIMWLIAYFSISCDYYKRMT
jgi:hypothetical protein